MFILRNYKTFLRNSPTKQHIFTKYLHTFNAGTLLKRSISLECKSHER